MNAAHFKPHKRCFLEAKTDRRSMRGLNQHPLSPEEPLQSISTRATARSGLPHCSESAWRSSAVRNLECDCPACSVASAGTALRRARTDIPVSKGRWPCRSHLFLSKNSSRGHAAATKTQRGVFYLDFHDGFCERVQSWRKLLCSAEGV